MSEIYIVNPYECFLLMCLLTDCPLAVFADIWEMSYEEDKKDMMLQFKGSSNQRTILVKESLESGNIVLLYD